MTQYDEREGKLANLVLNYSLDIQKGDKLFIQFDPAYSKYATTLGKNARNLGAEVRYDSLSFDPNFLRGLLERFDEVEFNEELERRKELALWCNARVLIDCNSNSDYAQGISNFEEKVSELNKRVIGPFKEVLYRPGNKSGYEVKWNIVGFPSAEGAKRAGMSQKDYEDFVYSVTLGNDWNKMSQEMKTIKSVFDFAKDVHIYVPNKTDLHLSLINRGGEICDGKLNMPDGEVCYGPVEDSANGYIYFQTPTKRDGLGIIKGIRLNFENGKIKHFYSDINERALQKTLEIDEGVRRIGEFGLGCNYGIERATTEILFDEKIGGTVHLALGDSLSGDLMNGGGLNYSKIHWDIVCDLRRNLSDLTQYPGGEIHVDGKLVQKNGFWKNI